MASIGKKEKKEINCKKVKKGVDRHQTMWYYN